VVPIAYKLSIVSSLAEVSPEDWNRLVPADDPFARHEFLRTFEESGSVGPGTGWQPCHLLFHASGQLAAAMPLYLKDHSYGEYIFDWAWAEAAQRAGLAYYPKLLSAVPFTPATGRRILTGTRPLDDSILSAVGQGLLALAHQFEVSSFHLLFLTREEHDRLGQTPGFISRSTHQYHWTNESYRDFEHWLSHFRSRRRKEVRRERLAPERLDAEVSVLRGAELLDRHWQAIEESYRSTVAKKGAYPYLTPDFFELMRTQLSHLVLALVAEHGGQTVATSLCFQQGQHLYGRYWGCQRAFRSLHFELCYHRPIELCIDNGWTRFEAGAQGPHKIRRGLLPAETYSVHWIAHRGLHAAVERAIGMERLHHEQQLQYLSERGPFHR